MAEPVLIPSMTAKWGFLKADGQGPVGWLHGVGLDVSQLISGELKHQRAPDVVVGEEGDGPHNQVDGRISSHAVGTVRIFQVLLDPSFGPLDFVIARHDVIAGYLPVIDLQAELREVGTLVPVIRRDLGAA